MLQNTGWLPIWRTIPILLLTAALFPAGGAFAVERGGYSMEVLVDGSPLTQYVARGTNYVEALKNREYSVRLRNDTGERVAIALSLDGLNSIDARTTSAGDARKWILGPYETLTLDGWQTTSTTAHRFLFTTEGQSYGSWLGRTQNLGLIAAAVFRERRLPPITIDRGPGRRDPAGESRGDESGGSKKESSPAAPPAAGAPGTIARPAEPDDLAATGFGRETSHPVRQVVFDAEDAPAAFLEIRYEYRDALVRLGVLLPDYPRRDPLARREAARGFDESGFCPVPHRRGER